MLYEILKFAHIAMAISWLGAISVIISLAGRAAKNGSDADVHALVGQAEYLTRTVVLASSMILLILGAIMVWLSWSFTDAWVLIGLVGVAMTGATTGRIMMPMLKRLVAMDQGPEATALGKKYFQALQGENLIFAAVLWSMVSKPYWGEWIELALVAAVLVGGGLLALRGRA